MADAPQSVTGRAGGRVANVDIASRAKASVDGGARATDAVDAFVVAKPERTTDGARGPKHYQFLDSLRGIAVLGVVAVHTVQNFHAPAIESLLGLGKYGVQLFYIVSAFSLCLSLDQRTRNERRPLLNYALRRFFRIAPLFYLAIVVYQVKPYLLPADVAPVILDHGAWPLKPWHVIATFLFVNGWHYQSINLIVPGCWSVAVETNFYLLLPFLFRYASSLRRALQLVVATLILNIAFRKAIYLIFAPHVAPENLDSFGVFSSMSLPSQLPVFALGLVMFHVFRFLRSGLASRSTTLTATYVGLSLAVVAALPQGAINKAVPEWVRVAVVLLFFSLLLAETSYPLFVNRATIWLGRISFSVYLWHFIAVHLVMWATHAWYAPHYQGQLPFALAFPCVLAITCVMSLLSYRLIEVPGQHLGRRLIQFFETRSRQRTPGLERSGISTPPH